MKTFLTTVEVDDQNDLRSALDQVGWGYKKDGGGLKIVLPEGYTLKEDEGYISILNPEGVVVAAIDSNSRTLILNEPQSEVRTRSRVRVLVRGYGGVIGCSHKPYFKEDLVPDHDYFG